ncbi:2TM domain-containing protein [Lewinella sp. IMCC34191]|uniref:2TM domain-containing protein n=1 Tax=Lewinella sp. IMCC34191 TaxID=2259172 RepID=UPI000E25162F|nr:2TM domain-containing protein [Lewinella sp. IMCC34191]
MSKRRDKKYDDKSLKEKKSDFRRHLRTYLVMCAFFVLINIFTIGSIGWAIWPILGWGIGVAMQGLSLYGPLADPEETHPRDNERGTPLPDLEDRMELRELERRPYRDEDLV